MSDFFGELAKQLAGRWLSLLAVPAVLFLAVGWIGSQLGQAHALDAHQLVDAVRTAGAVTASWPGTTQALTVVGALLAAVTVGLAVQALVGPVRTLSLGRWPHGLRRLRRSLTTRRRKRWKKLLKERSTLETVHPEQTRTIGQQHRIDRIANRINRISLAEPSRPTWMGDRIQALTRVAVDHYGLDLAFGWPRLWLVLPDNVRAEINTAQGGFATALLTTTWALPYLALGVLWWPAILVGLVIGAVGWSRARAQLIALTELAEAAIDMHARDLAIVLGVADPISVGPLTPDEGHQVTELVRKGR